MRPGRAAPVGLDAGEPSDLAVVEFAKRTCVQNLLAGRVSGDLVVTVPWIPSQIRVGGKNPLDWISKHRDHAGPGRKMVAEANAAVSAGISQ